MSIITAPWPLRPLTLRRTQNTQPAKAALIQTVAANAASLSGYVNGGAKINDVPNNAPTTPSGLAGHDHSGGEFGVPLFRSIGSWNLGGGEQYDGGPAVVDGNLDIMAETDDADQYEDNNATFALMPLLNVWVPPCDRVNGAYASMGFKVWVDYVHDGGTVGMFAGDQVYLKIANHHSSYGENGREVVSEGIGLTDTSEQKSESGTIELIPGENNPLHFSISVERGIGTGRRYPKITLLQFEIGVL